jgi:hypothetical protein
MIAFKFLRNDQRAPFSLVSWPDPGVVIEASGPLDVCRGGIHACRAEDLPFWLGERLWVVELSGAIRVAHTKVVAERGRLLAPVEAWPVVQEAFVAYCIERTAAVAAEARRGDSSVRAALDEYARDAAEWAPEVPPALIASVAAHAAAVAGWSAEEARAARAAGSRDPYDAERRRQGQWLAAALNLAGLERQWAGSGP